VRAAIGMLLRAAPRLRPSAEKVLWRGFYELASLTSKVGGSDMTLMNYGYADADADASADATGDVETLERFGLALYEAVAGAAELAGKDVLEVGCGRGGGAAFVFERFRPSSMTGVDLARIAVERCRRRYGRPGLSFRTADAQSLPFPNEAFDAVINVESSHCYPDMAAFLAEVHRVLRPAGLLLLADFRPTVSKPDHPVEDDVAALRRHIAEAGFRTLEEQDITAEVLRARSLATPALRAWIERRAPRPMRRNSLEFAAIEGSSVFKAFEEGRLRYLRLVLQRD
jgi:SAM-dependent methyltransferase